MATLWPTNALPQTQITIAAATVGTTYTLVGTFTSPVALAFVISTLNEPVQLSFDAVHDHLAVPLGSTQFSVIPLNFKSNLLILPTPTVYVKTIGTAPTTGNLYICGFVGATP